MDHYTTMTGLKERAARLYRRLERMEEAVAPGMFALVKKIDDVEFLVDPQLLWGPPRVAVRRGSGVLEVWLDPEGPEVSRPGAFTVFEQRRLVALVAEHLDDLTSAWFNLREDRRRGRLRRNLLVD